MREISCVKAGDTAHAETCRIPNVVEAAAGTFKVPPLVALVVRDILERMMELEDRALVRFRVNIKHIEVPEGIEVLAKSSFYDMRGIVDIRLPGSLKRIESRAFRNCIGLEQVTFDGDEIQIDEDAFRNCTSLKSVRTCDGAVYSFHGLNDIYRTDPEGVHTEKEQTGEALSGCTALMPCAVNPALRAGERAFADTLLGDWLGNGLHMVGNLVISGSLCTGEVILPGHAQGIAPYAFAGNRAVSKVFFGEEIRWIGEGAFYGCSGLEQAVFASEEKHVCDVRLGNGLRVDASAFEKCTSLREAVCPAQQAGESVFAGCVSLVRAELPRVENLSKRMFYNCTSLETCICTRAETVQAFCFCGTRRLRQYDFSALKRIGEYAFDGCESLKYAEFQDGVHLMPHALEDCSGLEEIRLSGEQGVIRPEEYALAGCTGIRRVEYHGKEWLFQCYGDILSPEIPEMVRLLFHSAFSCFTVEQETYLTRYRGAAGAVRIPMGIRRIAPEVFRDAMMLEQVEIPESVEYIGARAFHGTPWLAQKRREAPMITVRDMLLDGSACAGEVVLSPDIRLVCGWAFANGLDITGIRFSERRSVQVGEYAFRNCINLREMTLPDGMVVHFTGLADRGRELPPLAEQAVMDSLNCFKTDENGVLRECTGNISRLRLACGITEIGEGTFQDGNLLTTVTFSETVTKIGVRAFAGCKWLREVRQAERVTSIGAHAFSGCGMLRCVELSEDLHQIGARAFENCTALEEVQIPEGVEEIPERAFYRCHSLKNIKLPSTLKRIGREAFAFCGGASGLQVPEGVYVGERAFYGV